MTSIKHDDHWWRRASDAESVLSVIRDILDDGERATTFCDRIEQVVTEYERRRKAADQGAK